MSSSDKAAELLRSERDRFVAFSFASADILVELSEDGNILFIDGAISGLLGKQADELAGKPFIGLVHGSDVERARQLLNHELKEDRIEHVTVHLAAKTGTPVPFAMSGYKLRALKNHYYLTLTLQKSNFSAEELAKRDQQTGMFNKESFAEAASNKIRQAKEKGQDVKITLVDLPELRAFLDKIPTDAAHSLMGDINQYLRQMSLGGDTAGIVDDGAFSLVLEENVAPEDVMESLMEMTRLADPKGVGLTGRTETISAETPSLTPQDCANALLYTINLFASGSGEDFSIHSLSEGYQVMLKETVEKIGNFKNTVEGGSFKLAYQPIVDLKTGIIHHYEALVRIENDTSFSNPFNFISFGEQAGIIGEFDLAMTQRAFDAIQDANNQGHFPKIAVNLSGRSLSSNLYMDALTEIATKYKKFSNQLIFEVTESAKITDFANANRFLQDLRGAGYLCCLDDFGVGESSFDYLRSFQVDFVKIDGSYVRESMATERGKHLLRAMSNMCKELGIVTIGEMVEDQKVAALLWECGVRFGQGYLFGKPDVDPGILINCSQPNPHYQGPTGRARNFGSKTKSRWDN